MKPVDNHKLKQLFETLQTGNREEIKVAKKNIEKLWHNDHKLFSRSAPLMLTVLRDFDQIPDTLHKTAIIHGLSLFYLVFGDEYFEPLKTFIVKNLQHPDGRIREAARKTGDWLYISLSDRMRPFVYPKSKPLTTKQKDEQVVAKKQYQDLATQLETLINLYEDGSDDEVEFIDDMKPSINKSLQLFWSRLTANYVEVDFEDLFKVDRK